MNNTIAGWYVIYTRPQHEKKVSFRLTEMNIATLLPTVKKQRIQKDRKKYIHAPIFPSYIFVYLNDLEEYYKGLSIDGVLYYVRSGKDVARVSANVIRNVRILMEQAKDSTMEVSAAYFPQGKEVVIKDGPMTGMTGEIMKVDGEEKVLVRVTLLQRNILITLPSEDIIKIVS
ncbi:transcription antitermination factor NusG [Chitinophaga niastensis]|uniref:Transcription antitermination factor NusG n=1 Tax=Chitinophaga niastensis TaxID=536980 RepID=A0A2P8HD63_CHINA|nr:UpxY family transcription antiterminator [Chitinophaga niastensis]PSL44169.1 transcription antitermination factor NusG [Chitinophaga niastensis]